MPRTAQFFRDKVVLITGASSGIGEELAWQLGQAGAKLTLGARRADLLEALTQKIAAAQLARPLPVACDVTRDGDLERAVAETVRLWGKLDVAIANAGIVVAGPLKKLSLEDYRRQFETNIFGVLRTIYAALPEIEKTKGSIVIMGSIAGWAAGPRGSPYAMSKFALRALANSVTPELRRCGVKVTLISPGFVTSKWVMDRLAAWLLMDTGKAVRQMLRAVARGKREAIITGHGKILVSLERFAPWINRALGRRNLAKAGA